MTRKAMCDTPPMGWNSWNTFTENINEKLIMESADALVESGLADAGYSYIVIDDCWSLKERNKDGKLVADPEKFPNGMKAVADYVHDKGLKFGMYSCCGTKTCAGYPGSLEHEFSDARQFAEWGVDYLKYDNCYKPNKLTDDILYRRMGMALANCGRDIVFSACQWGTENVHEWIRSTGAHLFRSTGDIVDSWNSIKDIALSQIDKMAYSGNYCHNDMDMLVVGMHGKGGNEFISAGGCSDREYETHFALWAFMNSPLMIGCDIRNMSGETKKILTNKELIDINQDLECRSPYCIDLPYNPQMKVLVRPLSNGDLAIGFFNLGEGDGRCGVEFWDLGLPVSSGYGLDCYECVEHKEEGVRSEGLYTTVKEHGCKVYRCRLVKVND